MNQHKLHKLFFFLPFIIGLVSMVSVMTSCSDDDEELQAVYGYAQFKVCKLSSMEEGASRSTKLDYLNEAKKVKVVILQNGNTIQQTLKLNAFNEENAEYGLRSDKVQLVAGDYELIGFYLYDKLDKEIYSGTAGNDPLFTVVPSGLVSKTLGVDVVSRGQVTFRVVKEIAKARSGSETYNFNAIRCVSFTVKNLFTQELTTIEKLPVKYKEDFVEGSADDSLYEGHNALTSYCDGDSLVWLKAGSYQVTQYTTYGDKKGTKHLETAKVPTSKTFVVKDNQVTHHAEVPVQLSETDEHIKDYIALKEIWLALNGPKWSYKGESEHPGTNWNFNKDIDMWGQQPGVGLDNEGRVATLSLAGMGPSGIVPDAIGQLTKLSILSLGTHSEILGGHVFDHLGPEMTAEQKKAIRMDYAEKMLIGDFREGFSDMMQQTINMDPDEKPIKHGRVDLKGIVFGNLTNGITGISRAVMRLTELEQVFIANSPITTEDFFVDVQPESPFYAEREEWSWKNLSKLVDFELYNCPNLTALPMEMFNEDGLPELQMLNISCSKGISGEQLREDLIGFINGASGAKIQILYMGYNNLVETPEYEDLKKMKMLGMIDCTNNQIEKLHPFGKGVNLVNVSFDYNKITEIPHAEDGYFCGYNDMESFSFTNNQIKKFPNIFNAKSIYVMKSVTFAYNQIDGFEGEETGEFRGVNVSQLNLSNNHFSKFPKVLFQKNSPLNYLVLAGNKLTKIENGDLKGKLSYMLEALDLSYNRLTSLSNDFSALTLPYLSGLELSYNSFSEFPYEPLNINALERLFIRNQRDAEGNRCLREWPTGIYNHNALAYFCIGSNDLRKIEDTISPYIFFFDIKDNPNISIDLSGVCGAIQAGRYKLVYDKTQDIRGCDILGIEK